MVNCALPLSLVENQHFKTFISDLDSKFKLPSRTHITGKVLPELTANIEDAIARHLGQATSVALTLDIWTDRRQHAFLAITAHTFLQNGSNINWSNSVLLEFQSFQGKHSGKRISEAVIGSIEKHGLASKITYCVSDNASNMRAAFEVVGLKVQENEREVEDVDAASLSEFAVVNHIDDEELLCDLEDVDLNELEKLYSENCFHIADTKLIRISCFAHTIQLIVNDGIGKGNIPSGRSFLGKCSALSSLLHQSALFKEKFEQAFGFCRSVPSVNTTRWSSLYHHLESIASYESKTLKKLLHDSDHSNLILLNREEESLKELLQILQPFAELTDIVQGDKYPTIGCVVPALVSLIKILSHLIDSVVYHTAVVVTLLESIKQRFAGLLELLCISVDEILQASSGAKSKKKQKRCADFSDSNTNLIYIFASILDPSYGFVWLEIDHPEETEEKEMLKECILGKY